MLRIQLPSLYVGNYLFLPKLKLLIDNKELSKKMGEAGRKFIEEEFSTESMAKTFVDIIKPYLKDK